MKHSAGLPKRGFVVRPSLHTDYTATGRILFQLVARHKSDTMEAIKITPLRKGLPFLLGKPFEDTEKIHKPLFLLKAVETGMLRKKQPFIQTVHARFGISRGDTALQGVAIEISAMVSEEFLGNERRMYVDIRLQRGTCEKSHLLFPCKRRIVVKIVELAAIAGLFEPRGEGRRLLRRIDEHIDIARLTPAVVVYSQQKRNSFERHEAADPSGKALQLLILAEHKHRPRGGAFTFSLSGGCLLHDYG